MWTAATAVARWQKRAIELIFYFMANDKHTDDDVDYDAV